MTGAGAPGLHRTKRDIGCALPAVGPGGVGQRTQDLLRRDEKRPLQRLGALAMSVWVMGVAFELLAIWFMELAVRAPDLPWHD
jgi:hypothetical protein